MVRSAEILLADLDRFATDCQKQKWATFVAGLDFPAEFDGASPAKLVETLRFYGVPRSLCRFVGAWLPVRGFRINSITPGGAALSCPKRPTRGVPQEGAPSLPRVSRIAGPQLRDVKDGTRFAGRAEMSNPAIRGRHFRGDWAGATGETRVLAHGLTDSLLKELTGLDLDVSAPECHNFLADGHERGRR